MLTHFRSRRLAALLVAAGMTNAALLGAQGPTALGGIGAKSPALIADCDYTEGSCGGDPTYDSGGYTGTGVTGSTSPVCGGGKGAECKKETISRCIRWTTQSVEVQASVTGGGGGTTMICSEQFTTVWTYYWSVP